MESKKTLPGTPIAGAEWENEVYSFRKHSVQLRYAWDAGSAVSGFLEASKKAEFWAAV
jgi:hypothetical protein